MPSGLRTTGMQGWERGVLLVWTDSGVHGDIGRDGGEARLQAPPIFRRVLGFFRPAISLSFVAGKSACAVGRPIKSRDDHPE